MTGATVTLSADEQQRVSASVKDAFYEARDQGRTMHQAAADPRIFATVESIAEGRVDHLLRAVQAVPCAPIERESGDGFNFRCAMGCKCTGVAALGIWGTVEGARSAYLQHVAARAAADAEWPGSVDVDYREGDD